MKCKGNGGMYLKHSSSLVPEYWAVWWFGRRNCCTVWQWRHDCFCASCQIALSRGWLFHIQQQCWFAPCWKSKYRNILWQREGCKLISVVFCWLDQAFTTFYVKVGQTYRENTDSYILVISHTGISHVRWWGEISFSKCIFTSNYMISLNLLHHKQSDHQCCLSLSLWFIHISLLSNRWYRVTRISSQILISAGQGWCERWC